MALGTHITHCQLIGTAEGIAPYVGAGRKLGLPHLPTWSEDGARVVVGRWGCPILRPVPHLLTSVWSEEGADWS